MKCMNRGRSSASYRRLGDDELHARRTSDRSPTSAAEPRCVPSCRVRSLSTSRPPTARGPRNPIFERPRGVVGGPVQSGPTLSWADG